jgi:uncharacterized membrane protein
MPIERAAPAHGHCIMTTLILGLVLFLGIHSVAIVAPAWRDAMAAKLGEWPWKGLYSIVSIVGFVLIVMGYAAARAEPVWLYVPPTWTRHLAALLMLPVFPLLLAAYLPGKIKATLKHPMLVATKAWAVAHLLANGTLADVVLFGSLLAWAVAERISLKRRPARAMPFTVPSSTMNDVLAVIAGLGLYVAVALYLHQRWFGVAPFGSVG